MVSTVVLFVFVSTHHFHSTFVTLSEQTKKHILSSAKCEEPPPVDQVFSMFLVLLTGPKRAQGPMGPKVPKGFEGRYMGPWAYISLFKTFLRAEEQNC